LLEDGQPVCIRTIEAADEERLRAGIARMSPRSRYLRFFSGAAAPPDWVIDRLVGPDGHLHIAWGAIQTAEPGQPAIGAVHAIRPREDDPSAEFSVAVVDDYHGLGLGKILAATILLDARAEGLTEFRAHTLAENRQAIDFVKGLGAHLVGHDGGTYEYAFAIDEAIARLRAECDPPGIAAVFAALG
jgi:ribosomal protein S18 acetylase RimI-like enzyme